MILRCTQRLLKALAVEPREPSVAVAPLAGWHANLVSVAASDSLLLTHDASLFTLFFPGITGSGLQRIEPLFREALPRTLGLFPFEPSEPERIVEWSLGWEGVAKSNNRSVLRAMTEMVREIGREVTYQGGLDRTDLDALHRRVNEIPMAATCQSPWLRQRLLLKLGEGILAHGL